TVRFTDRGTRSYYRADDHHVDSAVTRCLRCNRAAGDAPLAGWLRAGELSIRSEIQERGAGANWHQEVARRADDAIYRLSRWPRLFRRLARGTFILKGPVSPALSGVILL